MPTTAHYGLTGLTCAHCVHAVTAELRELPEVSDVHLELRAGGVSTLTVTSSTPLDQAALLDALAEAGEAYALTDAPA